MFLFKIFAVKRRFEPSLLSSFLVIKLMELDVFTLDTLARACLVDGINKVSYLLI